MSERKRHSRSRREFGRDSIEGLESRELLSALAGRMAHVHSMSAHSQARGIPIPNPVQAATIAGATVTSTPHEVAKSQLMTTVTGSYYVGPGRYTSQASQTAIYMTEPAAGYTGESKIVGMAVYTPAEPGNPPTIVAVLQHPHRPPGPPSKLVVAMTPMDSSESKVLPTKLIWHVNGGMSTGIYKNGSGEGLAYLKYSNPPSGQQTVPGAFYHGLVSAHFSGLVHTNNLVQDLMKGQPTE